MKIAFLMQCHKNPKQINLLLDSLKHPFVDIFIHVDKKSSIIRKDIIQREGVYILSEENSINVRWSTYSQVEATLALISTAIGGV